MFEIPFGVAEVGRVYADLTGPDAPVGTVTDWVELVASCQESINALAAVQTFAMARVAAFEPQAWEDGTIEDVPGPLGHTRIDGPCLVAGPLGVSEQAAASRMDDAVRLATCLRPVLEVMAAGRLDGWRASVVASELHDAPAPVAHQVAETLAPRLGRETAGPLRRRVTRELAAIDPALVRQRAARARAERSLRRITDYLGVDRWEATIPLEDSRRAWAAVDQLAQQYVDEGRNPTLEQARVDAMIDLILGHAHGAYRIELAVPHDLVDELLAALADAAAQTDATDYAAAADQPDGQAHDDTDQPGPSHQTSDTHDAEDNDPGPGPQPTGSDQVDHHTDSHGDGEPGPGEEPVDSTPGAPGATAETGTATNRTDGRGDRSAGKTRDETGAETTDAARRAGDEPTAGAHGATAETGAATGRRGREKSGTAAASAEPAPQDGDDARSGDEAVTIRTDTSTSGPKGSPMAAGVGDAAGSRGRAEVERSRPGGSSDPAMTGADASVDAHAGSGAVGVVARHNHADREEDSARGDGSVTAGTGHEPAGSAGGPPGGTSADAERARARARADAERARADAERTCTSDDQPGSSTVDPHPWTGTAGSAGPGQGRLVEVAGCGATGTSFVRVAWVTGLLSGTGQQVEVAVVGCDPVTGARTGPPRPVRWPGTGGGPGSRRYRPPALNSAAYRPPAGLVAWVKARDGRCRFPGCSVNARFCDLDHVRPWPAGPTAADNLVCLCRRHHRVKQRPGWTARLLDDGTLEVTDPTGRMRTSTPVDLLGRPDGRPAPPTLASVDPGGGDAAFEPSRTRRIGHEDDPFSWLEDAWAEAIARIEQYVARQAATDTARLAAQRREQEAAQPPPF